MATSEVLLKHFLTTPLEEEVTRPFNLKNEIQNTLVQKGQIHERTQSLEELTQRGEALMISKYIINGDKIFGVFVHTDRQNLPLDESMTGKDQLSLEELIEREGEIARNYIRNFTYFAIKDNSVVLIEKQGIKKDLFARHLIWLLGQRHINLDQNILHELPDDLSFNDVSEVVLPPPFFEGSDEELVQAIQRPGKTAIKSLLDLMGMDRTNLDEILQQNVVGITLRISIRKREAESEYREDLAKHLSSLPDHAKLKTRSGRIIHGSEVREQKRVRLDLVDERNKIFYEDQVFDEMNQFFQEIGN